MSESEIGAYNCSSEPDATSCHLVLDDVMTFAEAAERWGLSDPAILRVAVTRGRFRPDEIRKSLHVWLVTRQAMERVFGPART